MNSNNTPNIATVLVLAMTAALGPLAVDTFLPAFPAMANALNTDVQSISLSISIYVMVLAIGQLIAGPLSDRYGRRGVVLVGLAVFSLTSFALAYLQSMQQLLMLRSIQAFGAGFIVVSVPAIVRDRVQGPAAAKLISTITVIMMIAPAVAPAIGTALLRAYQWPSIFFFLSAYSAMVAVMLRYVMVHSTPLSAVKYAVDPHPLQRYLTVLRTREALPFIFILSLSWTILLLFIMHSPYIYQIHFGHGPEIFSTVFACTVGLLALANLANRKFLKRYSPAHIMRRALAVQVMGMLCVLLSAAFSLGMAPFSIAMMLTVGVMGAINPNAQALFMDFFGTNAGTAAAVMGATQFTVGGLIATFSSALPQGLMSVVLVMAVCSAAALTILTLTRWSDY